MGFVPLLIKVPVVMVMAAGGSGILPGTLPAPSAGGASVSIVSGVDHVTADGHVWELQVAASEGGGNSLVQVVITNRSAASTELHSWGVTTKSAVITKIRGGWKIEPKASVVAPILSVNLTYKITSHSAVRCTTGSETVYHGTLSGRMILTSHLPKLGSIGSKAISFSKPNIANVIRGCQTNGSLPCQNPGYRWLGMTTVNSNVFGTLVGSFSRGRNTIELQRQTFLAKPAGSDRVDDVFATGGKVTVTGNTLVATPGSSSAFKGHVKIAAGPPTTITSKCTRNGSKHTQTDKNFSGALTSSLVAHTLITGTISAGTSGSGTFDKYTIK